MTINEAIEIQKKIRDGEMDIPEDKWTASCNLGIEALKRVKQLRLLYNTGIPYWLPGETKE